LSGPSTTESSSPGLIALRVALGGVLVAALAWGGLFFPLARLVVQVSLWLLLAGWLLLAAWPWRRGPSQPVSRRPVTWTGGLLTGLALLALVYAAATPRAIEPGAAVTSTLEAFSALAFALLLVRALPGGRGAALPLGAIVAAATGLTVVSLLGAGGWLALPLALENGRLSGTIGYPNTFAIIQLVGLQLVTGAICGADRSWRRLGLALAGNVLATGLLLTYSRAGYLALPFGLLATWLALPAGRRAGCVVVALVLLGPPVLALRGISANLAIANPISAARWLAFSLTITLAGLGCLESLRLGVPRLARAWGARRLAAAAVALALVLAGLGWAGLLVPSVGARVAQTLAEIRPEPLLARLALISADAEATSRLQFYADALRMFAERPLLGWGGGGWAGAYSMFQPYFYISNLAHSHFLEVAVATGAPGLLVFVGLWLVFGLSVWRARRRVAPANRGLLAGVAGAGAALALHSSLDFDLSFFGVFLVLVALWSVAAVWAGDEAIPAVLARPLRAGLMVAALGALVVCGLAALGQVRLASAEAAWGAGDLGRAEAGFAAAVRLDPLSVPCKRESLSFYLTLYRCEPGDELGAKVVAAADDLARADRYVSPNISLTVEGYLATGRWSEAVTQARLAVARQPYYGGNYDLLGPALAGRLLELLAGGDLVAASATAQELASLPDVVERRRAEALGRLGEGPRSNAQIQVTPRLALEAAKARYFFRDWNGAQTLLDVAKKDIALTLEWGRWSYLVAEAMVQAGVPGAEAGLARLRGLPYLRFIQEQPEYQLVKGLPFLMGH